MSLTASGLEQLAGARVMLAETKGFLYLPVFVPHQVAGEDVLQDLRAANEASGYAWREIGWPKLRAATDSSASAPPTTAEIADARRALLTTLDENMGDDDVQPRTLVLDASPSSHHLLAQAVVVYLNQRRQSLCERAHRLIVIWPLPLRDDLIGGAPDLWSVRALAPCLSFSDSILPTRSQERESTVVQAHEPIQILFDTAAQERKFALWRATGSLREADLSLPELFRLLDVLWQHHQGQEMMPLIDAALAFEPTAGVHATLMNFASLAHMARGDRVRALSAQHAAVLTRRRLAQTSSGAYDSDLAGSLNNLAHILSEFGDRDGSLAAAREAFEINRRLAETNVELHELNFAGSLSNLANALGEAGDAEGALGAARQAAAIYRRRAQDDPAGYEPVWAASLSSLANFLHDAGERESALVAAHEGVELFRRLWRANPAAYAPDLAKSLTNFSSLLTESGNRNRAPGAAREAVTIRRLLAQANPAAYAAELARSLCVYALALRGDGQVAAAREVAAEAVTLLTPLSARRPDALGELLGAAQALLSETDLT